MIPYKVLTTPLKRLLLGLLTASGANLIALEPNKIQQYDFGVNDHSATEHSAFLGIGSELGLWEDGVVRLAYNHSGARSDVTAAEITAKLQEAFQIMENLADLDFQFLGESNASPLDFNDGVVTIGWEQVGGITIARAGPSGFASFSTIRRLGYVPYVDGSFQFNSLHSGEYTVGVVIHEMMHLLGLGHSDNPVSIMTPLVTRYNSPQADDIAALQAMYGPPDTLLNPTITVDLNGQTRPGFSLDSSDSGLVVRRAEASSNNDISSFNTIDSSFANRDEIFIRLNYSGAAIGDSVQLYLTDPNGFVSLDSTFSLSFTDRIEFFFIEFAEALNLIPGQWTLRVGIEGSLVQEIDFTVEQQAIDYNRAPSAALSAVDQGNGLYSLSVAASDPDGDNLTVDWHIPGEGVLADRGTSLNTVIPASTPARMFVAVKDDGIKRDGASSGIGFGALQSQYLVTPAESNVPTYFAAQQILHVPSISINGQSFALNLKLTQLAGVQFKLVDFYPASTGVQPSASVDLATLILTLPRLIIQNNGVNSEISNLQFDFVAGSEPVKFAPRL